MNPVTIRSDAHSEEIATVWNYMLPTEENAELICRAVNSFDALLAVAKAADTEPTDFYGDNRSEAIAEAMDALDAAHPGWREWAVDGGPRCSICGGSEIHGHHGDGPLGCQRD